MVAKNGKQTRIEGTYDEIPEDLEKKVGEYVSKLRSRMKAQAAEGVLRDEVIELMKEHKIDRVPLDDEDKILELSTGKDKIKIKKLETAEAE